MLLGSWVLELMFFFFSKKWGIVKFHMMIKSFFDGLFVWGVDFL